MTFGTIVTGNALEGFTGEVQTILQETINPGEWYREKRHKIQEKNERIDRKLDRGVLSRDEADRFKDDLQEIREKVKRMEDDGSFSLKERDHINHRLEDLHRDIAGDRLEE
jgi:hypothetical protein